MRLSTYRDLYLVEFLMVEVLLRQIAIPTILVNFHSETKDRINKTNLNEAGSAE